jgi:CHAD domain-containing protein
MARSAKGLRKALDALELPPTDEALHNVRIRAKRLRYVLDTLGFLGPPVLVKGLVTRLKESQEGLGRFQDRSILLERLRTELQALREKGNSADPVALGLLAGTMVADHGVQKARALEDAQRLGSRPFLKALGRLVSPEPTRGP